MPWDASSLPPHDSVLDEIAGVLDPVLVPLGFAPGQLGASEQEAQVIFCRGDAGSDDGGCIDLVIDLQANPAWRITDVRYWGFPSERWHLAFPADSDVKVQLDALIRTLPTELA